MAHDGRPPLDVFDWWRAVRESDVSALARTCAWALGLHADKGFQAFPSQTTLAKAMGYESARQARRAVRELREAGLLEVQKRGPGRPAIYTLIVATTEPDAKAASEGDGDDLRGHAAQLVRTHWWQAKKPPREAPEGWHMGQEYSFLDPCAKRNGWPVVTAAIPLVRETFSLNGEPFTGRLVFSRKTRARWQECLSLAERTLIESDDEGREGGSGGSSVGELLEEVSL